MELIQKLLAVSLFVLVLVSAWKVYVKAGQPGWAVIVPFYNLFVWIKIGGRPGWWFVLFLLPLVNLVCAVILSIDIAKKFGKGVGFGLGLAFIPFVFFPILGLGDATYRP